MVTNTGIKKRKPSVTSSILTRNLNKTIWTTNNQFNSETISNRIDSREIWRAFSFGRRLLLLVQFHAVLLLLFQEQFNVTWAGHVGIDSTVCSVGPPSDLGSPVHLKKSSTFNVNIEIHTFYTLPSYTRLKLLFTLLSLRI